MSGESEPAADVLAAERAVNERYQRMLEDLIARQPEVARIANTTRNQQWTGTAPRPALGYSVQSPLIGRVAFGDHDEDLESGFYVGSWYQEWEGVYIVSWAAPVAELFYAGRNAHDHRSANVAARRTFVARLLDLVDYVDEMEAGVDSSATPFSTGAQRRLQIPKAPAPVQRPTARPEREATAPTTSGPATDASPETAGTPAPAEAVTDSQPPTRPTRRPATPTPALRAERAVRAVMERPRTGSLGSVLATLQPDQYRLVTWPQDRPLIVQGHPGTGKTIIATHRAAYLTHPDRAAEAMARVALIGPTRQYAEHVRPVVNETGAGDVRVLSLPDLLLDLAGLRTEPAFEPDELGDTAWSLGLRAEQAVRALFGGHRVTKPNRKELRSLVDALGSAAPSVEHVLSADSDLKEWIGGMTWDRMARSSRYVPFLAACGAALRKVPEAELVDHLLVDEAQDVRPLEWRILLTLMKPGGTVSLFGDVNQRRSDWTSPSWTQLAEDLELTAEDGTFDVEELAVGYRSTKEILGYANQLLPKGQRKVHALRDGSIPTVTKVAGDQVDRTTVDTAAELADRHRDGLVAVISMDPRSVSDRFRSDGWSRPALQHTWARNGRTVLVLHPSNARGLEFDGVVVVEPSAFPENVGRLGLLYTSLTRATKDLAVVFSQRLPKTLRDPR